ncbi:hypothetical protein SMICM304S_02115 [Streptomyces microflavus]
MRVTAMELEARVDTAYVTAITIEDHRMAVRGDSTRPVSQTVHLQSLPYAPPRPGPRGPHDPGRTRPQELAHRCHPGHRRRGGAESPGPVTGKEGTAHLDADATGRVTDRRAVGDSGPRRPRGGTRGRASTGA